jgi:hypothetical protein
MRSHVIEALMRYVKHGISPGSGLKAVLTGDLFQAKRCLDSYNWERLDDLVDIVQYTLPMSSYGSKEAVKQWETMTETERAANIHNIQHSLQMLEARLKDIQLLESGAW